MAFVCGISGEVPQVPMVSVKSGEVFEQRLLEQYVKEHSKHPVSGQACTIDEFVAMSKTLHVQPRVPSQTSIPSIIKLMQDEWDAMNIENYTLRQQLQQTRQELSRALYQHDAACRVIARLTRERDQARHIAQDLNPNAAVHAEQQQNGNGSAMEVDADANGAGAGKLSSELVAAIKKKNEELCAWRKNRAADAQLADKESFASYAIKASFPGLHGTKGNAVTAMGLVAADNDLIVSGGNDKSVVVYSQKDNKIVHKFKSAHSKKVTDVLHHPSKNVVYSCGADKQVKVLDTEAKKEIAAVKPHKGEVSSLDIHPTGLFYLSTSVDGSWALVDEASNEVIMVEEGQSRLTCGKFHPDGLYMATGAENGEVLIWDMERQEVAHKFEGHAAAVCSMSFSGTGRYFATSALDGVVKIWDLVKLTSIHTIEADGKAKVNTLAFDESGQYLVTGGTQVNVYVVKKKSLPLAHSFTDVPEVSTVHFGAHAQTIVAACTDRSIKILGA